MMDFAVHESLLENKYLKDRLQVAIKGSIGKRRRPARFSPRPKLPEEFLKKAKPSLRPSFLASPLQTKKRSVSETCLDRIESRFEDPHQPELKRSAVLIQTWERRSQSENRKIPVSHRPGVGKENRPKNNMPDAIPAEKNGVRPVVSQRMLHNGISDPYRHKGPSKALSKSLGHLSTKEEPEWISLSRKLCAKFVQSHLEPEAKETVTLPELRATLKPVRTSSEKNLKPKKETNKVVQKTVSLPPQQPAPPPPSVKNSIPKLPSEVPQWVDLSRKLCTKFIEEHIECETRMEEKKKSSALPNGDDYDKKTEVRIVEKIGRKVNEPKKDVPEWITLSRKLRAKFIEGHKDDPDTISLDNQLNASDLEEYLSEAKESLSLTRSDLKPMNGVHEPNKNKIDKVEDETPKISNCCYWSTNSSLDDISRHFIVNGTPAKAAYETLSKSISYASDDDVNYELTFETFQTEFELKEQQELDIEQHPENQNDSPGNVEEEEKQIQNVEENEKCSHGIIQNFEPDSLEYSLALKDCQLLPEHDSITREPFVYQSEEEVNDVPVEDHTQFNGSDSDKMLMTNKHDISSQDSDKMIETPQEDFDQRVQTGMETSNGEMKCCVTVNYETEMPIYETIYDQSNKDYYNDRDVIFGPPTHTNVAVVEKSVPKLCSKACNTDPDIPNTVEYVIDKRKSTTISNGIQTDDNESICTKISIETNGEIVETNGHNFHSSGQDFNDIESVRKYFDSAMVYEPNLPNLSEISIEGSSFLGDPNSEYVDNFIEVDQTLKCRIRVPPKSDYEANNHLKNNGFSSSKLQHQSHEERLSTSEKNDAYRIESTLPEISNTNGNSKPSIVSHPAVEYANLPMVMEPEKRLTSVKSYVVGRKKSKKSEANTNKERTSKYADQEEVNSYFPVNPPHEFDSFEMPAPISNVTLKSVKPHPETTSKYLPSRSSKMSDSDTPNSTPFDSRTLVSHSSCASDSDTSSWTLSKPTTYQVNPDQETDVSDCSLSVKFDYTPGCSNQSTLESKASSHEKLGIEKRLSSSNKMSENRFSEVFVDCETSRSWKKSRSLDHLNDRYPPNGKSNFFIDSQQRDSSSKLPDIAKDAETEAGAMPESLRHLFNMPMNPIFTPTAKTSMLLSRTAEPLPNHYYSTVPVMNSGSSSKKGAMLTNAKPKKTERSSSLKIKDIAHGIILTFRKFQSHSKSSQISSSHYVDVSHLAESNGKNKGICLDRFPSQDLPNLQSSMGLSGYGNGDTRRALSAGYFGDRCTSESNLLFPSTSQHLPYVKDAETHRPKSFNFGKITEAKVSKPKKKETKGKKSKSRNSSKSKSKKLEPKSISSVSRKVQQMADGTLYLVTTVSGDTNLPGVYSDSPDTASEISVHGPTKINGESNC